MNLTFRPSNLHRRKACPGSARLEALYPQSSEDSEYAAEGRLMDTHFADKSLDRSKLTGKQQELLRVADAAQAEAIARVVQECGLQDRPYTDGYQVPLPAIINDKGVEVVQGGTCDYRRVWEPGESGDDVQVILDLKSGFNEVDVASDNSQLAAYAVEGWYQNPTAKVFVAINQPRAEREKRLTLAFYEQRQIPAIIRDFVSTYEACQSPDAPLNPSLDACRYCSAAKALACPALNASVSSLAGYSPKAGELVKTLSAEELGKLADCVRLARSDSFGDEVIEEVKRRIHAGEMPGWKIKSTGSLRTLTDAKAAFLAFKERWPGHAEMADSFLGCMAPKFGELEKLVGRLEKAGPTVAKRTFNALVEPLLVRVHKEPTVARTKGEE